MRASPAFHITLECFGAWRSALLTLMFVAAAALGSWCFADDPQRPFAVTAALAIVSLGISGACATSWRCPPMRVRWDGQSWYLAPAAQRDEVRVLRLDVALDLGAWMLLRFEHDVAPDGRSVSWLPAQRWGHASQWHALRCAVYCARPSVRPEAGEPWGDPPESEQ